MVLPSFGGKAASADELKHGVVKTVSKAKGSVMSTYWKNAQAKDKMVSLSTKDWDEVKFAEGVY